MRHFIIVCLLALVVGSVGASKSGGVIYLHDPDDTMAWSPLLCSSAICEQVQRLVLPRLLASSGDDGSSSHDETALTRRSEIQPDGTVRLTLRDDLLWEDGTPVTAYDVFYTFLTFRSSDGFGNARAMLPLDATTLLIEQRTPSCTLGTVQMTILPAHALQPDFAAQAADSHFTAESDASDQLETWLTAHPWNAEAARNNPYHISLPITLMGRDMAMVSPGDFLRVQLGTGEDSVGLHIYSNIASENALDYFLSGQLDVIGDVPFDRWADLVHAPGVTVYHQWTYETATVIFNLADPSEPNPYKDQFDNTLPQKPHPILGDLRVRQAIAAAIDVNDLIEVGLNGFGRPTNETFMHEMDLSQADTPRFDPVTAERLLTEAGWVQAATGQDGIRRCQGCTFAEEGTSLSLTITARQAPDTAAIMTRLETQMRRVGIDLSVSFTDVDGTLKSQTYDLAFVKTYANDNTLIERFISANDGSANVSSYANADLDPLLKDIDSPAAGSCDAADVQARFDAVEKAVDADLPQITLFGYEKIFAVHDWVLTNDAVDAFHSPLLRVDEFGVYYGPQER